MICWRFDDWLVHLFSVLLMSEGVCTLFAFVCFVLIIDHGYGSSDSSRPVFWLFEGAFLRKRACEADWGSGRIENCEIDGDNFAPNSSGTDLSAENLETAWDSNKRQKFDESNVKYGGHRSKVKSEGSVAYEAETSSIESTSILAVGGEAFTRTECLANPVSHNFTLLGDKIIKLDEADREFTSVQNRFFTGLGMLASYTTIKGIYKDCHRSTSGLSRLQAFKRQEEITRTARGDANVKYAWYGTSKQGVSVIVLHGFGQPRIPKNGAMYGVGVYLAPEDYSHVRCVVFCQLSCFCFAPLLARVPPIISCYLNFMFFPPIISWYFNFMFFLPIISCYFNFLFFSSFWVILFWSCKFTVPYIQMLTKMVNST